MGLRPHWAVSVPGVPIIHASATPTLRNMVSGHPWELAAFLRSLVWDTGPSKPGLGMLSWWVGKELVWGYTVLGTSSRDEESAGDLRAALDAMN